MTFMTKEEIVKDCIANFIEEDFQAVKDTKDLVRYHLGYGMHVRNTYGLWKADNPLVVPWFEAHAKGDYSFIVDGIDCHPCHPHTVSMDIIRGIWNEINFPKPDLLSLVD